MTDKGNKILFISYSGPLPAVDGKRQRTDALLRALSYQYEVDFLIIDNQEEYDLAVSEYTCPRVKFIHYRSVVKGKHDLGKKLGLSFLPDASLMSHVAALIEAGQYQFIFARYIHPVAHLPKEVAVICDIDDDFTELQTSRIRKEKNWLKKLRLRQIFWLNKKRYASLLHSVQLPIYVKEESVHGFILPNLPFQLLSKPPLAFCSCVSPSLLFVGKLSYAPNALGIKWFIKEVWPSLVQERSDLQLTLVSNTPPMDKELVSLVNTSSLIKLMVNVEDVSTVYRNHSVVIAPVFQGGGSSIKVAEALLMGRPVITTSFGARGFAQAQDRHFIMKQDTPNGFRDAVITMVKSTEQLVIMQRSIKDWAEKNYSLQRWGASLLEEIENRKFNGTNK